MCIVCVQKCVQNMYRMCTEMEPSVAEWLAGNKTVFAAQMMLNVPTEGNIGFTASGSLTD